MKNLEKTNNNNLEQIIEDKKTNAKLEAMDTNKRIMYKEENELKAREKQGQIFLPGKCLPPEYQKLKTADKLCIIGFAPSWDETPWDDETFDIWGINELYMQVRAKYGKDKRFTLWSEIHNPFSPTRDIPAHHDWMKKWDRPILMQHHYDWIPNSIPYPKDAIIDFFNQNFIIDMTGSSFTDYSNQISVMTALAIMLGYKEIHIYGVDMAQDSEYAWQRASCQFFIGYAAGLGIKVLIPLTSELCKYANGNFYGYDTNNWTRMYTKKRVKTMKKSINQIRQQMLLNDYERKKQKEINQKNIENIDSGLQRIDDELVNLDIKLNANKEIILKFLQGMPNDLKKIMEGRDKLLGEVTTQNTQIEDSIKKLSEDKKKLLIQKQEIERADFMQETTYEEAKKNFEFSISGYQGIIADGKHYLDNNII